MADEPPSAFSKLEEVRAERVIGVSPDLLWSLWTTKAGLESWWSPEGFTMKVVALQVRPGGRIDFRYEDAAMAGNPEGREKLRVYGTRPTWSAEGIFLEVDPLRRLAFRQTLDFDLPANRQAFGMTADFRSEPAGTRLILTAAATPSKHWTLLARANLIGQLERLARGGATAP